jgi:hypothetical protein
VKYTSQVIGEVVVLATTRLATAAVVEADTVTRVEADMPTFLAT